MNRPDDVRMPDVPEAVPVVDPADLARVGAWADRKRQELVELRAVLEALPGDDGPAGSPDHDPIDPRDRAAIEAAVDVVLADAMARLDADLDNAHDEASRLVADAMGAAMVELTSAEIDPVSVLRLDLTSRSGPTPLRRPRPAAELSRVVRENRRARAVPDEPELVVELDPPSSPPVPADEADTEEGDTPPEFSDFWLEVPSDKSVLERIRRRRPKGA